MQPFNNLVRHFNKGGKNHLSFNLFKAVFVIIFTLTFIVGADNAVAETEEFDEAEIFFELNNTDGDLGIHSLIDGEPYDMLQIFDPDGNIILNMKIRNSLQDQGLTEFFYESAEPPFSELDPADFFNRFPDGEYTIKAMKTDGGKLESTTDLTHIMPAPPGGIIINGENELPISQERCDDDDENEEYDPIEVEGGDVNISWNPVTMSHPDAGGGGAGQQPPVGVIVHNYEVVLEATIELGGGEEFDTKFSVILPPDVTSITVPEEFISQSDEFKYEILVREESYNQTAIESCFVIEEEED